MKKAFGQTVRDIKREVNKKVLKVPSIEQKVLDATSNEPWGPHGLLLADIAQSSRNYHEYQMIMGVLWKRINDTGKNWRHVYKALSVLEYMIAHGSERVIDEIREHAYQISTLSNFQYIDSSGRDQGNNVRKKSQSIVVLVNDKERVQEVRQKASAHKDKYRNTSMGDQSGYSSPRRYGDKYDDDHREGQYGNRDNNRNGYGRETDSRYRDEDRYSKYGDSYGHEGEKYRRDHEEQYNRDGYRDDDYRGRGQSTNDFNYGSRDGSADLEKYHAYEEDGQYSTRASGAKADDHSQDGSSAGKRQAHKYSEQNLGAPPSYEESIDAMRSPTLSERDGESSVEYPPRASSPPADASPNHATVAAGPPQTSGLAPIQASTLSTAPDSNKEVSGFDEFDPRGSFSAAAPATSNDVTPATQAGSEMDFLGSLSDPFSSNAMALVPVTQQTMTSEVMPSANPSSGTVFTATSFANQPLDDPFGDDPFKAIPSTNDALTQQQLSTSSNSFNPNSGQSLETPHASSQQAGHEFGDPNHVPFDPSVAPPPANSQPVHTNSLSFNQDIDILADILPPSISPSLVDTQSRYPVPPNQAGFPPQDNQLLQSGLLSLTGQNAVQNSFQAHNSGFPTQLGGSFPQTGFHAHPMATNFPAQSNQIRFHPQSGQPAYIQGFTSQIGSSQVGLQLPFGGLSAQQNPPKLNPNLYGIPGAVSTVPSGIIGPVLQHNLHPQAPQVQPNIAVAPVSTMTASSGSSASATQPGKDKFETKSTVWADTLSRGLVNLNISGSKTNPLADIGVDFDAINRKEKRMEKPTTATTNTNTAVTSTTTMGKAMGSGSGLGRAGAGALRPVANPMMGPGVNMNPMGGPGAGMNMGGGYGVNQSMVMQQGFPTGSAMPGPYNPAMGMNNYSQPPYGGGHQ